MPCLRRFERPATPPLQAWHDQPPDEETRPGWSKVKKGETWANEPSDHDWRMLKWRAEKKDRRKHKSVKSKYLEPTASSKAKGIMCQQAQARHAAMAHSERSPLEVEAERSFGFNTSAPRFLDFDTTGPGVATYSEPCRNGAVARSFRVRTTWAINYMGHNHTGHDYKMWACRQTSVGP